MTPEEITEWYTGRDFDAQEELYTNFEKVAELEETLKNIKTNEVETARSDTQAALDKLNNTNGMAEFIGQLNSFDPLYENINDLIDSLVDTIVSIAEDIKTYEAAGGWEHVASTFTSGGMKMAEGGLGLIEAGGDAVGTFLGWCCEKAGWNTAAECFKEGAKDDWSSSAFDWYWESDWGKKSNLTRDSAAANCLEICGSMLTFCGVSAGLTPVATSAVGAESVSLGSLTISTETMTQAGVAYVTGFGSEAEKKLQEGGSFDQAMVSGTVGGAKDAAVVATVGTVADTYAASSAGGTALKTSDDVLKTTDDVVKETDDVVKGIDDAAKGADDAAKGASDTAKGADDAAKGASDTAKGADDAAKGADDTAKGASDTAKGADDAAKGADDAAKGADDAAKGADDAAKETDIHKEMTKETEKMDEIRQKHKEGKISEEEYNAAKKEYRKRMKELHPDNAAKAASDTAKGTDDAAKAASETAKGADDTAKAASETAKGADDAAKGASDTAKGADDAAKGASETAKGTDDAAKATSDTAKGADDATVNTTKEVKADVLDEDGNVIGKTTAKVSNAEGSSLKTKVGNLVAGASKKLGSSTTTISDAGKAAVAAGNTDIDDSTQKIDINTNDVSVDVEFKGATGGNADTSPSIINNDASSGNDTVPESTTPTGTTPSGGGYTDTTYNQNDSSSVETTAPTTSESSTTPTTSESNTTTTSTTPTATTPTTTTPTQTINTTPSTETTTPTTSNEPISNTVATVEPTTTAPTQAAATTTIGGGYSRTDGYTSTNAVPNTPTDTTTTTPIESTTNSIDDIIKGNNKTYKHIPKSTSVINKQTTSSTGRTVLPIAAGVAAAAAAGIGAKAYIDRKKNNDNDEDEDGWDESNGFNIEYDDSSDTKEETLLDDNYEYQPVEEEKYDARSNDELTDMQ